MCPRTDEDTISLLRRLATLYPDEVIAGIFNRQARKTATGERFTANQVGSLRRYRSIPRFQPQATPPNGELVTIPIDSPAAEKVLTEKGKTRSRPR